jgi:hypothetical protein
MTPQDLYLNRGDNRKWFTSTFQNAIAEEALQAVFTQYCIDLGSAVDGGTAIALNAKRQGAAELLQRIAKFTLPPEPPKRNPLDEPLTDTTVRSGPVPVRKPQ